MLAAILWGGGDFSGGMGVTAAGGSVRGALRVILSGHGLSLAVLAVCLWLTHAPWPPHTALLWGLGGGVASALGLIAFYLALAGGAMGASAAISGLLAAAIPAAVSLSFEGSPGALKLGGFALAGLAIWLIAASTPAEATVEVKGSRRMLLLAIAGGLGFGVYFVALRFANPAGVLEPIVMARVASITTCALLLLALTLRRAPTRGRAPTRDSEAPVQDDGASTQDDRTEGQAIWLTRRAWLWTVGIAVLDTGGNLLFMASTRTGRLDVAAVLASLYPASTILLAAVVLGERPRRRQALGMGLALAAVVFITV